MSEILIGTDPELFVMKGGKFISGHDLIPGTKEDPYRVEGGAIQVDGVAVEFNTDPADNVDDFTTNIKLVMDYLKDHLSTIDSTFKLVSVPTAVFDKNYFDSLPEKPKLLGCSPDYNAYSGKENTPPSTDQPFRTGAGHIHIGWDYGMDHNSESHKNLCCDFVKHLDTILYPSSLLWDTDNKRRTLYGKAGAFRPKPYGLEYRPFSNAYLKSVEIQKFVFNLTKRMSDLFFEGTNLHDSSMLAKNMMLAINEGHSFSKSDIVSYLEGMSSRYEVPLYVPAR
jgi:hypothetical protein